METTVVLTIKKTVLKEGQRLVRGSFTSIELREIKVRKMTRKEFISLHSILHKAINISGEICSVKIFFFLTPKLKYETRKLN